MRGWAKRETGWREMRKHRERDRERGGKRGVVERDRAREREGEREGCNFGLIVTCRRRAEFWCHRPGKTNPCSTCGRISCASGRKTKRAIYFEGHIQQGLRMMWQVLFVRRRIDSCSHSKDAAGRRSFCPPPPHPPKK